MGAGIGEHRAADAFGRIDHQPQSYHAALRQADIMRLGDPQSVENGESVATQLLDRIRPFVATLWPWPRES